MVLRLLHLGLLFLSLSLVSSTNSQELLGDTDGQWSYFGFQGYAGEVTMNALTGSSYFYWLFQAIKGNISSTTDKLPLIIWIQGGPGCSGETGMFFENIAPFYIDNNTNPQKNPYTWTNDFHIMTIDHPLGTGYSVAGAPYDMKNTTTGSSIQLYNFLVKLANKYPTWFSRDLYFFGESFGGHWIPGIAYQIVSNNRSPNPPFKFNLKGVGIGDPWTDPPNQSQTYGSYAYATGIIDQEELGIIQTYEDQVTSELNTGSWNQALNDWEQSYSLIVDYAGGINVYNSRDYNPNYNMGQMPAWLNLASTKQMIHVPSNIIWTECNNDIYNAMTQDIMTSAAPLIPYLLDSIKVLIYNGQDDLIVNTPSTEQMLANLNWPYISNFINSNKIIWNVNGNVAGYAQTYNNLSFVVVLKSGHMVPHDQPVNALNLVYRFVNNQGWQ
ncbi:unnamed protein product [Blepharisma stoltei]|uniref:Serine carboxypeptidase n=1 Tax=Blepharisma stoltei TaxID=1481888 RepID=A0AAU9ITM2_9CILI|nr:unnamed protein product [Blepharisma stoltei]